ncbi:MAG: SMI1/KNR4 family protein [Anaerolineaceae bacterium]|nr:SMI1/KNR4 family protein [Anaerolineaceae bacterium]
MNENIEKIFFIIVFLISLLIFLMGIIMLIVEKIKLSNRNNKTIIKVKTQPITDQEMDTIFSRLDNLEQSMKETSSKYNHWIGYWKALFIACRKHDATSIWKNPKNVFQIEAPATEENVICIEKELGCPIPENFRKVLLNFSSTVNIQWFLNEDDEALPPLNQVCWGECRWNLQDLPQIMADYQGWLTHCFSNPQDSYDAIWYNKFPIIDIRNGDKIAIELNSPKDAVVYLSHDDGIGHGYIMGNTFEDFIERHSKIGCPGYEEWLWTPFASEGIIDPNCENALAWRKWFGLELNDNEQ